MTIIPLCPHGKVIDQSESASFAFAGFLVKCACCGEWMANRFRPEGGLAEYCDDCQDEDQRDSGEIV